MAIILNMTGHNAKNVVYRRPEIIPEIRSTDRNAVLLKKSNRPGIVVLRFAGSTTFCVALQ